MIKNRIVLTVLVSSFLVSSVMAQSGKAPCGSFQKLPDGKWRVVKLIKIEHEKAGVMLSPGTIIAPGTQAAGVDMYAALQKSCH